MEVNQIECIILRHWYKTRGCESKLTEEGFDKVLERVVSRWPNLAQEVGKIRITVIETYVNSTARPEDLAVKGKAARVKKQKAKIKDISTLEFLSSLLG